MEFAALRGMFGVIDPRPGGDRRERLCHVIGPLQFFPSQLMVDRFGLNPDLAFVTDDIRR
jgi:hypothetical protein